LKFKHSVDEYRESFVQKMIEKSQLGRTYDLDIIEQFSNNDLL